MSPHRELGGCSGSKITNVTYVQGHRDVDDMDATFAFLSSQYCTLLLSRALPVIPYGSTSAQQRYWSYRYTHTAFVFKSVF